MQARNQLLRLQKNLYGRFQTSARNALGSSNPAIRRYFERYQKEFQKIQSVINGRELIDSLIAADILICGDYHTLSQAQRSALDLFRALHRRAPGKQHVLALEMLPSNCTPWAESYLEGMLSEREFLERIAYWKNWGFRWENYRELFQFAKTSGISIVGLNIVTGRNSGTLQKRDEHAATVLAQLRQNLPTAKIFVLFGDLHLAEPHLPRSLDQQLERRELKARVAVVHQNAETVYWKLARRGVNLEDAVAKLSADRYCLLNVAPWVKLQSYLDWIEITRDDESFSRHASVAIEDWNDNVDELRRLLADYLGIKRIKSGDFSVISVNNPLSVAPVRQRFRKNRRRWNLVSKALRRMPSLFLVEGPWLCLRRATHNQLGAMAASLLHNELSGGYPKLSTPKKDFYRWVWAEALAFLGSKIINPNRRAWTIGDYLAFASLPTPPAPWLRSVGKYFDSEPKLQMSKKGPSFAANPLEYLFVARAAGRVLGNALYKGHANGSISKAEIAELFRAPTSSSQQTRRRYFDWISKLATLKLRP